MLPRRWLPGWQATRYARVVMGWRSLLSPPSKDPTGGLAFHPGKDLARGFLSYPGKDLAGASASGLLFSNHWLDCFSSDLVFILDRPLQALL